MVIPPELLRCFDNFPDATPTGSPVSPPCDQHRFVADTAANCGDLLVFANGQRNPDQQRGLVIAVLHSDGVGVLTIRRDAWLSVGSA